MFRTHSTPPSVALSSHCSSVLLIALLTTTLAFAQIVEPPLISFPTFADVSGLSLTGVAARVGTVLRLTPAQTWDGSCAPRLAGNAWFSRRMPIAEGFETTFEFQITNLVNGGADGLAFVIHDAPTALLTVGGSCAGQGYFGIPRSLAVEFDTWLNPPTDFFMNLQGDPNANHVAVITRGQEPNHPSHAFALGTATNIRNLSDGNVHAARIIYTPGELSVFLDNLDAPALTVAVDLPATLGLVDGYAWVGFGAATGGAAETHDLVSWSLSIHRPGFPSVPEDLSAQLVAPTAIQLTWVDTSDNETRFVVERRRGVCGWEFLADTSANAQTYLDRLAPSGEELCYRVSAVGDLGASAPTDPACLTTPPAGRQQLMVYVGDPQDPNYDHWVGLTPCSKYFNSGYGTAVIVHGWNPPIIGGDQLNGWMRETAREISLRLNQRANVIAWEWLPEATGVLPPWQNIQPQAEKLANGLKVLYGRTYSGPVHMIGHSMGSLLIVASAEILSQELSVLGVYPPAQLTLLDTPDKATGSTNIDRLIKRLRASGVYVDSYYGCTNISTHHANLWVDVPCFDVDVCDLTLATLPHCHQAATAWYQGSVPLNRAPILRQASSCFADTMLGTLGFGVSILATDPGSPNRHRPQALICPETSTLKFSKLSFCSLLTEPERGIFGLDESSLCLEKFPPVSVAQPPVDVGWYWASEPDWDGTCVRPADPLSFCVSPKQIGQGGGGQVAEGVVGYSLDFVVDATWDYFSFEYDFQSVAVSATLEVSLLVGESIYPIFQMLADLVVDDEYLESGQLDIRALHGQTMTLQFALHTAEPGGVLSIRDLVFWRDQWNGNRPPVAVAGPDQVIATGEDGLGHFSLDGSASFDPEGESLTYQWMLDGELFTTGQKPKVELSVGVYEIILVVRDPAYQVSADTLRVLVGSFLRGDSNADGRVDISDAINTLGYLFTGAGVVPCADAADANDDGVLDISDAIFTLAFLFLGDSLPPPAPYPAPGVDLTMDALGCDPH